MKLSKLIKDLPALEIYGSKAIEITGISNHSKRVGPGNLFIAKKGAVTDGNLYTPEAVASGAVAIVTDIYDPSLKNATQIICENIEEIEAVLAARYYEFPSKQLIMVGATGTKGKTTTTYLMQHLLDRQSLPCGLMGTIEYCTGTHHYPASHTTPDVLTNHRMLREMIQEKCRACVMEVSSHALDQGRVSCIDFDVCVYTNLYPDHLDYHGSMEEYVKSKNILFAKLADPAKKIVYNADCPMWKDVLKGAVAKLFSYSIETPSDLRAENIKLNAEGSFFDVVWENQTFPCRSPIVGLHNVYNVLAALAAVAVLGYPLKSLIESLETFPQVPGRLERVSNPLGLQIYVDFAHTGDSIQAVLKSLLPFKKGRLITVFGCGGDRDPGRRPSMAKAVEKLSDITIVTSDNPRTEDPQKIIDDIMAGFSSTERAAAEPDRYAAIEKAVAMASPGDLILIAGKGHEKYQLFANKRIEFDDCKVAYDICKAKMAAV
jgi:UDP-N-acetylmuramoyl-L-alanyl-D-glutamate--2,6-diaminopimelate ligase